jgi:Response regulators consisting of a CheY-like receiver domain and a winged-helix DNA-binding domain
MIILCVDDERDVLDLLVLHLERADHVVRTAMSGHEALISIARHPPQLVILDLMLPDIDGFGVCEILRRQAGTAALPIILLTAWATQDARRMGFELGALEYLTKPFSPREIVERVARYDSAPTISSSPVASTE